ncbi:hypothetical protein [Bacillus sp. AFS017274]|uniref:hypothetical protein n=1 Tax=Bacillus sp. AFS017274 TaxID=2033488 RepID=UPI0015CF136C|nr:hypothetical protein [Bacillus sp. AFS017274]
MNEFSKMSEKGGDEPLRFHPFHTPGFSIYAFLKSVHGLVSSFPNFIQNIHT